MSSLTVASTEKQQPIETLNPQLKKLDKFRLSAMISSLIGVLGVTLMGYTALHGNNTFFNLGAATFGGVELAMAGYFAEKAVQISTYRNQLKKEFEIINESEEMQYSLRDLQNDVERNLKKTIDNVKNNFNRLRHILMTL